MTTAFCFDLDGTVVSTPLVALVATASDVFEEIEVLGRATDEGHIPYDRSLRLRCRLLRDVPIAEAQRRIGFAAINEDVLEFIRGHANRCFVLTALPECWTEPLAARLGCRIFSSRSRVVDGSLIDLETILDKGEAVRQVAQSFSEIVAVGSGINDLPMFAEASVRVAFGMDLAPGVLEVADYWTPTGRSLCQLLRPL